MCDFSDKIKRSKLIIFDLGNVLLDVNVGKSVEAYKRLGVPDVEKILTDSCAVGGAFIALEQGTISTAEFCEQIRRASGISLSDSDIVSALNAMLGSFPDSKVELVERLRKRYTVVLLSNTNAVHKECFDTMARGYKSLSDLFDRTWYSHEMHLSKPSAEIFTQVLEYHKCKPTETSFFDDSSKNVAAAQQLGINAFLVSAEMPVEQYFSFLDEE